MTLKWDSLNGLVTSISQGQDQLGWKNNADANDEPYFVAPPQIIIPHTRYEIVWTPVIGNAVRMCGLFEFETVENHGLAFPTNRKKKCYGTPTRPLNSCGLVR